MAICKVVCPARLTPFQFQWMATRFAAHMASCAFRIVKNSFGNFTIQGPSP